MYGPPGCSKTMTAKALATESGLNFLSVRGPELISKWVGETEFNIREVFRKARDAAPSIIFFDEFDGLAKGNSGHESLSPVKALLTEMDGVIELKGVLVLAASNRPDLIDTALLRPGRFDYRIYHGPPDINGRVEILELNTRNRHVDESVKVLELAENTENWSGAELVSLCKNAANIAESELRHDPAAKKLTKAHFDIAFKGVKPQITLERLHEYENWEAGSGIMQHV
jgi:AAA family ATPase